MTTLEAPTPTLATPDVAAALGVCHKTLLRWLLRNADGGRSHIVVGDVRVPAVRVGRAWRIVRAPFEAALRGEVAA